MRVLTGLIAFACAAAGTFIPTLATAAPTGAIAVAKACSATVSNSRPTQNSTVTVAVKNVGAGSAITTVAHYKSTNTKKSASASPKGTGSTAYKISRATHGFRVVVAVSAVKAGAKWSCSTSFTTR